MKRSVVPVVCYVRDENGNAQILATIGSGFVVNKLAHFVTADHVLRELWKFKLQKECTPAVYFSLDAWETDIDTSKTDVLFFNFSICSTDRSLDLAVCKPDNNPFKDRKIASDIVPVRLGSYFGYPDGSPVAFTGFPIASVRPITSKGYVASYRVVAREIVIDKHAWPGASGSPVYTPKGLVIGVIVKGGKNAGIGLAYARPVEILRQFLGTNNILID